MEISIFDIVIFDIFDIIVGELIGAAIGEIPFIGPSISCVVDFSIKIAELFWGCFTEIPISCICGLTQIDASFYKGMEEFPLVIYDLINHLFGKG